MNYPFQFTATANVIVCDLAFILLVSAAWLPVLSSFVIWAVFFPTPATQPVAILSLVILIPILLAPSLDEEFIYYFFSHLRRAV